MRSLGEGRQRDDAELDAVDRPRVSDATTGSEIVARVSVTVRRAGRRAMRCPAWAGSRPSTVSSTSVPGGPLTSDVGDFVGKPCKLAPVHRDDHFTRLQAGARGRRCVEDARRSAGRGVGAPTT